MAVTSTTLAGVNVWQFSGTVTDAALKTAWAGLIVNNRYKIARSIYIDSTADLTGIRGSFYVDMEANSIILHTGRNKTNTVFNNFELVQTVGLSVGARNNFVRTTDGTTISTTTTDGIDMKGGAMIYAVVGNPGGGDPRYLNEMIFGSLDGTLITSVAFTEQEIEPTSYGRIWKGLSLAKVAGYPILGNSAGTQRQVVYRSTLNSEGTQRLVRPYCNNSVCYVSSYITRNGVAVTSNLMDTFGSTGSTVVMVLNSWKDESWFGASKTSITGANWNAGNRVIGGVMKKIQVQPSTLIRTYDSRSTTASQKSTFSETTQDFLSGTDSTTAAQATRAADSAVMTGTNFSSWYNQSEGTFLAKADSKNQINSAMAVVQVSDGTVNNRIGLYKKYDNNLDNEVGIVTSSVGQAFLTQPVTLTDMNKNAFCYKINDIAFSANGLAAAIDTLATIPTVSQMVIGNGYGLNALNGHISKLAYYPRRLTNAQLQEMTA